VLLTVVVVGDAAEPAALVPAVTAPHHRHATGAQMPCVCGEGEAVDAAGPNINRLTSGPTSSIALW
jgi:hypothetical protein